MARVAKVIPFLAGYDPSHLDSKDVTKEFSADDKTLSATYAHVSTSDFGKLTAAFGGKVQNAIDAALAYVNDRALIEAKNKARDAATTPLDRMIAQVLGEWRLAKGFKKNGSEVPSEAGMAKIRARAQARLDEEPIE